MKEKNVFAWTRSGVVTHDAFDQDVLRLCRGLPSTGYVHNPSEDRYHFALLLAAAWRQGITTLLPSDRSRYQQSVLDIQYPMAYRLDESRLFACSDDLGHEVQARAAAEAKSNDFEAVIPFTSGTTGHPVPHPKRLFELRSSSALIDELVGGSRGVRMVATVPAQHMYGLELSVLLPLFEGALLDYRRPFFPADILKALEEGPSPVALVTTPLHLRALMHSGVRRYPEVAFIVCATAPLSINLAKEVEQQFKAPLYEIYGCTELGSIAGRRPAEGDVWTWFQGVRCSKDAQGILVTADHMRLPGAISDAIEPLSDRTFRHLGRSGDLVNIAGKRTSLTFLESCALTIDGVKDVAFLCRDDDSVAVPRLSAWVVLEEGTSLEQTRQNFRDILDPAFVPRSLKQVEALPRNRLGKITRQVLDDLIRSDREGSVR